MVETTGLQQVLLPELEHELDKMRTILTALPDGHNDFKPHERSFTLARLAGHVAELPSMATLCLTGPDMDFATAGYKPLYMESRVQLLADFNEHADTLLTTLKNATDQVLDQTWKVAYKGHNVYSGSRYGAYREMGMNQMIHHRGQLSVYLRLLNIAVPGMYGPSADGI